MKIPFLVVPFVAFASALACDPPAEPTAAATQDPAPAPGKQAPVKVSDNKPMQGHQEVAVLETNHGTIVIRFFEDKAPKHVESFKTLAGKGFFDGTKFHRVIPGFMIQGGDPLSKESDRSRHGTGDPGYSIKAEFNDIPFTRGIVGAARSSDPDSAGSQFFIMVDRSKHLDGQYTVFGEVIEGMEVADKIVALPRDPRDNPLPANEAVLKSVKILKRPLAKP